MRARAYVNRFANLFVFARARAFAASVFHATGTYSSAMIFSIMTEQVGGIPGISSTTAMTLITALIVVALGKLNQ